MYRTPPPEGPSDDGYGRRVTRSQSALKPTKELLGGSRGAFPIPLTPKPKRKKSSVRATMTLPPTPQSLPRPIKRARNSGQIPSRSQGSPNSAAAMIETATGPAGKILLAQEILMHDPWKMLVMTTVLNKTSGRAVRPIFDALIERYPTAEALSSASTLDLSDLLYPLGLFNQRASSLIRFSEQYLLFGWPMSSSPTAEMTSNGHRVLDHPMPVEMDVRVFYGSGVYASDSFRIYSPLLPGGGATRDEGKWVARQEEPLETLDRTSIDAVGAEHLGGLAGTSDVEQEQEWRKVRPLDKELRRYLIWRWGIEGIIYDIDRGPQITRERDRRRLSWLLDESTS